MELFRHCIIVASNYIGKKRKGLHFLYNESNFDVLFDAIRDDAEDYNVSIYFINTDSYTMESVKVKDAFFKNMDLIEGTNPKARADFYHAIRNEITILDMALLFLARYPMDGSELFLYLFFYCCEYYVQHGNLPFEVSSMRIDENGITFKDLNRYIGGYKRYKCDNEQIVISKFLNCEDGIELMNDSLIILGLLTGVNKSILQSYLHSFVTAVKSSRIKNKESSIIVTVDLIKANYVSPFAEQ